MISVWSSQEIFLVQKAGFLLKPMNTSQIAVLRGVGSVACGVLASEEDLNRPSVTIPS